MWSDIFLFKLRPLKKYYVYALSFHLRTSLTSHWWTHKIHLPPLIGHEVKLAALIGLENIWFAMFAIGWLVVDWICFYLQPLIVSVCLSIFFLYSPRPSSDSYIEKSSYCLSCDSFTKRSRSYQSHSNYAIYFLIISVTIIHNWNYVTSNLFVGQSCPFWWRQTHVYGRLIFSGDAQLICWPVWSLLETSNSASRLLWRGEGWWRCFRIPKLVLQLTMIDFVDVAF